MPVIWILIFNVMFLAPNDNILSTNQAQAVRTISPAPPVSIAKTTEVSSNNSQKFTAIQIPKAVKRKGRARGKSIEVKNILSFKMF